MSGHVYSRGESFWNSYLKRRSHIPDSFFERFYTYHAAHGGQFEDVNDVGAGLGNLSIRLAERFARVLATEPSHKTHEDSERFIRQNADDPSQFSFIHAAAEDDVLAPASVDAVFSCNTMHWTDLEVSIPTLARQLTSGGTLFLALIGTPVLLEQNANTIWQRHFASLLPNAQQQVGAVTWDRTIRILASGYDAIPVPEELFEPRAIRLRLNASEDMREFSRAPGSTDVRPVSSIGEEEEVRHEEDRSWFFEADVTGLREVLGNYTTAQCPAETDRFWQEMEKTLGGKKVQGFYPVSIVIATRR